MIPARAQRQRLPSISFEEVLDRLQSVRRLGPDRAMAKCPSHDEKTPSLSVRRGEDGRTLLHDFGGGCTAREIAAAIGVQVAQLFPPPPSDLIWSPRPPRVDPLEAARAGFLALCRRQRATSPARMAWELAFCGKLILAGTAKYAAAAGGVDPESIRTLPLKLILYAARELVGQGTPRGWFHPIAVARVIDRAAGEGTAKRYEITLWARLAIGMARRVARRAS